MSGVFCKCPTKAIEKSPLLLKRIPFGLMTKTFKFTYYAALSLLLILFNRIEFTCAQEFLVDKICYLNSFEPNNFPWKKEQCLNFEEVFKNYQYYEAKWSEQNQSLEVRKFENGQYLKPQIFVYKNGQLKIK